MFIKEQNTCPCAYCKYFKLFEYNDAFFAIQNGVCKRHNLICALSDQICEDFVLKSGIYTSKWYPNKK